MAEYVLLTEETLDTLTSADLNDPIDLTTSTSNQISNYPSLITSSATYVAGMEDSTDPLQEIYYYTSANFPTNIIDLITKTNLQIIDWPKFITAEETWGVLDANYEDSILEGNVTIYSTDFVSITSFNLPEVEPLAFPERWAG